MKREDSPSQSHLSKNLEQLSSWNLIRKDIIKKEEKKHYEILPH